MNRIIYLLAFISVLSCKTEKPETGEIQKWEAQAANVEIIRDDFLSISNIAILYRDENRILTYKKCKVIWTTK